MQDGKRSDHTKDWGLRINVYQGWGLPGVCECVGVHAQDAAAATPPPFAVCLNNSRQSWLLAPAGVAASDAAATHTPGTAVSVKHVRFRNWLKPSCTCNSCARGWARERDTGREGREERREKRHIDISCKHGFGFRNSSLKMVTPFHFAVPCQGSHSLARFAAI